MGVLALPLSPWRKFLPPRDDVFIYIFTRVSRRRGGEVTGGGRADRQTDRQADERCQATHTQEKN